MGRELACVRRHHCLFPVFSSSFPWLFVVTTLPPSSSLSIGWIILPSNHPPSSSTSFHLTSHRFITSQMALDTTRELVFLFLIFASCRFPLSLSLPYRSARSLLLSASRSPSVNLSSSLSLARVHGSSRTDSIHIQVHKTSQNTRINPPFFFPGLRSSIGNPIPSSISVCLYPFFRTRLYLPTSCVLHSAIFEYLGFLRLHSTYIHEPKSPSSVNVHI